ncbi:Plasmid stabilization system protein ParE [Singulisphaera sp. GP187]|uniref:type II toxin-antitoxin system RelE/ParE family toxin n=1 Tax=Singulisphaera sp. GP187 TaxID=1882752 RepID=UPI0009262E04|nr:type II toxin-antitoxin system RelE/ParE family toxin [Singulisphaera sp. GP187]SIO45558.1 Plasmid stabilization system protein ParE [Singulisphaera sp. GP187]
MNYRIELAATAKADIRETTRWLRDEASQAVADRWLAGLDKAMATLASCPLLCPVAAENDKFDVEIRELLHGRKKNKYRIIFTIRDDQVFILYVRHVVRDEIEPETAP